MLGGSVRDVTASLPPSIIKKISRESPVADRFRSFQFQSPESA